MDYTVDVRWDCGDCPLGRRQGTLRLFEPGQGYGRDEWLFCCNVRIVTCKRLYLFSTKVVEFTAGRTQEGVKLTLPMAHAIQRYFNAMGLKRCKWERLVDGKLVMVDMRAQPWRKLQSHEL